MSLIEQKARGQQAENLLNDDMFKAALREVRYAAHRAFEAAQGDPDRLRRASMILEAAGDFQRFLTLAVRHGVAASKEIDRQMQAGEVVRGIGRLVRNRDPRVEGMPWNEVR